MGAVGALSGLLHGTEDPRSRMLRAIAEGFGGPRVDFAVEVERRGETILAELKPGRELHTNVEFYAGVVMELCGVPPGMFTLTCAAARAVGWSAKHPGTGGGLEDHPPGGAVCGAGGAPVGYRKWRERTEGRHFSR